MLDADLFLGGLKDLENLQSFHPYNLMEPKKTYSTQCSMVVIRDSSLNTNSDSDNDTDFSIFPPSNHENLTPFSPLPPSPSSSPSSPFSTFSFPPSDSDSCTPPSPPSVSHVPRCWGFALRILRSKFANIVSYIVGRGGVGNVRTFRQVGNVGLVALVVVMWWLCVRIRRRSKRKESVGHFLKIIREKDEKIIQLLNQIAQMNELLLARHKAMTSKLID